MLWHSLVVAVGTGEEDAKEEAWRRRTLKRVIENMVFTIYDGLPLH